MLHSQIHSEAPLLIIGAAGVDLVGRLDSNLQPGTSNPAHIRGSFGGVARNVAENLARLGHPVILLSAVGEDQTGDQLIQHTTKSGVDTSNILRSSQFPTGTYLAVLDQEGYLKFALDDMRTVTEMTPAYVRQHYSLFKEASALFFDANLPPETLRTVFSQARRAKIPVCGDPTSTSLASRLIPYLDSLQIVIANSNEAAILSGKPFDPKNREDAMETAKHLVSRGVEFAIVTMAEFGLSYATAENSGHTPALNTVVVDPTGAGDALIATILFALLNDIPTDEAVRLGVAAASLTLRHQGAVVPDLSLEKLYDHLVF